MAENGNGGAGHNFNLPKEDLDKIKALTGEIVGLEADRDEINAEINSRRKQIKALGIDLDAWRAAKRRFHMDADQRERFDQSQANVNAALGIPVQADLFGETEEAPPPAPAGRGKSKPSGGLPAGLN